MYLLDTNIYISFYDRYYPRKHFPTFWREFTKILDSQIVTAETYQSSWFVEEYLKQNYFSPLVNQKSYEKEWAAVLQHIADSPYYSDQALSLDRSWANESIADGWIIAIAKKDNLTIVTDEQANLLRNRKQPSKNPKIPDIAADCEVRCINRLEFFNKIKLQV